MNSGDIRNKLISNGLRVTPQRIAVLDAVTRCKDHPTTERIHEFIKRHNPNISTATVYKILDVLSDHNIIKKVKTDTDVMRYDAMTENHHHLYCAESDRIEDYNDDELSQILEDYFSTHKIPGFQVEDVRLQIIGKFRRKETPGQE